ncbi:hypothetical protein CJF30_00002373 [Rutstroemia sp. NJR-2017a BBW]|nr:hypothetical protein CJF30_00002373 [Rutstroemia sp. NJR-2017a BBW]
MATDLAPQLLPHTPRHSPSPSHLPHPPHPHQHPPSVSSSSPKSIPSKPTKIAYTTPCPLLHHIFPPPVSPPPPPPTPVHSPSWSRKVSSPAPRVLPRL